MENFYRGGGRSDGTDDLLALLGRGFIEPRINDAETLARPGKRQTENRGWHGFPVGVWRMSQ